MRGEVVLVIEDNPLNMELVSDLLDAAGYVVRQAGDAEAGIEIARNEVPQLILLDVGLPGMDGLAAAGVLGREELTRDIPVVILTAHAMKGDEEKALAQGCAGYISKPIDTRSFLKTLEAFLHGHEPR